VSSAAFPIRLPQLTPPARRMLGAASLSALAGAGLAVAERFGVGPHTPDLAPLAAAGLAVQAHVASAVTAFLLGLAMFARVKGDGLHRAIGWAWVAAMFVTAASSLFITGINGDAYSLIHLISGWTLVALPMAVYAARKRRIAVHRRAMTGLFLGGLVIAGALTFLPGRVMFRVFFG
jgi:uncharacterized membrane protein